jgi:type II secretory pathway component PulL
MGERRRIRPLAALLHIGKLVAQCRDAAVAKASRDLLHEFMGHARARAVGKDEACPSACRLLQQRGHRVRAVDVQSEWLRGDAAHPELASCGSKAEYEGIPISELADATDRFRSNARLRRAGAGGQTVTAFAQ